MHTAHNLGLILPKSNSAKNNFFENITIKLFWRVDFPLPHGAKPLEARGEATSVLKIVEIKSKLFISNIS